MVQTPNFGESKIKLNLNYIRVTIIYQVLYNFTSALCNAWDICFWQTVGEKPKYEESETRIFPQCGNIFEHL